MAFMLHTSVIRPIRIVDNWSKAGVIEFYQQFAPFLHKAIQYNNTGSYHLEGQNMAIPLPPFKEGIHCLEQALRKIISFKDFVVATDVPYIEVGSAVQQAHPAMTRPGK